MQRTAVGSESAAVRVPGVDAGARQNARLDDPKGFVLLVIFYYTLLATFAVGASTFVGPVKFACQVGMGIILAHGTELAHQALHKLGTGRARWDAAIGMALCWPTGVSLRDYRWHHLRHHKINGAAGEVESFAYQYNMMGAPSRDRRLLGLARHLMLVDHWVKLARRLTLALGGRLDADLRITAPEMSAAVARRIQNEYRAMAGLYTAVFASVALGFIDVRVMRDLWLIPVLLWAPAHALIELPEHIWTAARPNGDPFQNTRTIRCGRFAAWLVNGNAFHVEHHANPLVAMRFLRQTHDEFIRQGRTYAYLEESYPSFFWKLAARIWRGPRQDAPSDLPTKSQ